jgi:mono/diheme cytochrome c family protein
MKWFRAQSCPQAALTLLALAFATCGARAEAGTGDTGRGATLYAEECAICHGARGEGGVGPSLKNLSARRDIASTEAWIKDPSPRMPKFFPTALSAQDVNDVASFVSGF